MAQDVTVGAAFGDIMVLTWAARRRQCLLAAAGLLLLPCTLLVIVSGPDTGTEQALLSQLAELQARLQHLEALHRTRQEEVRALAQTLASLLVGNGSGTGIGVGTDMELRALQLLLPNNSVGYGGTAAPLHLPSAYHFLPHLLDTAGSLRPAYCLSKGRVGVSTVLGVPTVRRQVQSYLLATLHNLVDSMSPQDANDTLIVVFVAETDHEYVGQVARQLEMQFPEQLESGLLELVSPPVGYYPDLDSLQPTLNDSPERVRWRTKQNLDFAFLMMYAQPRGTFYVQLEDDILAKKGFVSTMKSYALRKISEKAPWFVIEFCQLGFIGKMFKCVDLPWLVQFFLMFYNDKPVDWLLDHLISTKICSLDKDSKHCKKAKSQLWLQYKPSLFQHIGTHSSLKGKVQKLKDKQFGRVALFFPHKNPEATVQSGIKHYKQYSLSRAYAGETFFWGLLPQPGDQLTFIFSQPTLVKRYLFRSGNAEHPSDRFYNTTVEVLPESNPSSLVTDFNSTSDGYVVIGHFDGMGIAEGAVNPQLGPIRALRLNIHSDSENWAILSEIHVMTGS